jgi:ABC-type transport system involved in cytochrome bd biosynthesis fused ATPase/permease subunit
MLTLMAILSVVVALSVVHAASDLVLFLEMLGITVIVSVICWLVAVPHNEALVQAGERVEQQEPQQLGQQDQQPVLPLVVQQHLQVGSAVAEF